MQGMKTVLALLFMLSLPLHPSGAADTHFETNAQFEASQKARSEGFAAFRAGDHAGALVKLEAALALRPDNSLLLGYVAYLAAETGDTPRATEVARRYAALGLAPGQQIQDALEEKLPADDWAEIKAGFTANITPQGEASIFASVPPDIALIEGIALGPDGRLFVSSVVSGGIYAQRENGWQKLISAADRGMGSFFGIAFDALHGSLWATYGHVDQTSGHKKGGGKTGIAEFDATTGKLKHDYVLQGSTAEHQIADLLITRDHTIYASDASGKAVYKVADDALIKAFDLPFSTSPQGLAESAQGGLFLADYGRGLWLLDPGSGRAALLGVPRGLSLLGIDGLAARGNKLIAIQNGVNPHRVLEITLSDDGKLAANARVLAQNLPGFDEPTLGVGVPNGYIFVAGSQWPKYGPGGTVKEGVVIQPTSLMRLP